MAQIPGHLLNNATYTVPADTTLVTVVTQVDNTGSDYTLYLNNPAMSGQPLLVCPINAAGSGSAAFVVPMNVKLKAGDQLSSAAEAFLIFG